MTREEVERTAKLCGDELELLTKDFELLIFEGEDTLTPVERENILKCIDYGAMYYTYVREIAYRLKNKAKPTYYEEYYEDESEEEEC